MKFKIKNHTLIHYSGTDSFVYIPNTVKYINENTFNDSSDGIKQLYIPPSVTHIDTFTFSGITTHLKNIFLSNFHQIHHLHNAIRQIPHPIKLTAEGLTIEYGVLYGQYTGNANSMILPNRVTHIADSTFSYARTITHLTLPNRLTSIGRGAFSTCLKLQSIKLPQSLTVISENVFTCCINLTSVSLPTQLQSIQNEAFLDCDSLTSITIPDSVTFIGSAAFSGCHHLRSINLPPHLTCINDFAFAGCYALQSITIPNAVTSIGKCAFLDSGLTTVTVPHSVTSMGKEAFLACDHLTSIDISDNVTTLNDKVFAACPSLTRITLPYNINLFHPLAIKDCHNLQHIIVKKRNHQALLKHKLPAQFKNTVVLWKHYTTHLTNLLTIHTHCFFLLSQTFRQLLEKLSQHTCHAYSLKQISLYLTHQDINRLLCTNTTFIKAYPIKERINRIPYISASFFTVPHKALSYCDLIQQKRSYPPNPAITQYCNTLLQYEQSILKDPVLKLYLNKKRSQHPPLILEPTQTKKPKTVLI